LARAAGLLAGRRGRVDPVTDADATAARRALDAALEDPARLDVAPLTALPAAALDETMR
jgi:hypothetical protein